MKRFDRLLILLAVVLASIIFMATGLYAANHFYQVTNLVSDSTSITATHVDPHLINSWGIAFDPNGFACVADNGTGVATFYNGAGVLQTPVITGLGAPTGVIFKPILRFPPQLLILPELSRNSILRKDLCQSLIPLKNTLCRPGLINQVFHSQVIR